MGKIVPMSANIDTWSPHAKKLRLVAFLRLADEFHLAARKVSFPLIKAFLLGHALELYLKSFLLSCGLGEKELKDKFRHNLDEALSKCIDYGLEQFVHVSAPLKSELKAFSVVYKSKAFEYFSITYLIASPRLPPIQRLFGFAASLQKSLGKAHVQTK